MGVFLNGLNAHASVSLYEMGDLEDVNKTIFNEEILRTTGCQGSSFQHILSKECKESKAEVQRSLCSEELSLYIPNLLEFHLRFHVQ